MKQDLKRLITNHYKKTFAKRTFKPGVSSIPINGKVFDQQELYNGVEAILDGWWTEGRFAKTFEKLFRDYYQTKFVTLVNSGSSANLIAFSALTSVSLGERAIKPGDEVITVATGFPTTVNPILQNGCIPVFIDIDLKTKNATVADIEKAITKKTKAIMMAHTLGNVMPLDGIMELVKKHNLWFIEDCCDAIGSTYQGRLAGTFGHLATFSFYPAHQMTMGEGGAIITKNPFLERAIKQFRDWGRDCWCDTGKDNTCGRRFDYQLGQLPYGYDHKFTYSQIGYNLKLTDMQAAIGVAQFKKLPAFNAIRRHNFARLYSGLIQYKKYFILPESIDGADTCWFGFPLVIADGAPFTKLAFVQYLEAHHIGTRGIMAGNLVRHPSYSHRKDIRIIGSLTNADKVMNDGFWIGCYQGITNKMIDYILQTFADFLATVKKD